MTGAFGWDRPILSAQARELYDPIQKLPIVSPHGHCDPAWFADDQNFSDPSELLIIPDHYVFRMLYSQGIPLEKLGIGIARDDRNPREIFRLFAGNWHLFLGTPSRQWLEYTFACVLGIQGKLTPQTADDIYDQISRQLASEVFRPRRLYDSFNLEVLATTDGAIDDLVSHRVVRDVSWSGRMVPTFRPDSVLNPNHVMFADHVRTMAALSDCDVQTYDGYLDALRVRRQFFIDNGATATDHDVPDLATEWLSKPEIEALYSAALAGTLSRSDATRVYGHMLIEMAQMSIEDGLVMQLHVGSTRSTNQQILERFGSDKGSDIPKSVDWVAGLNDLLNRVGNNPDLTLILFTLDETTYARELAPMVGHWPALRLGPPWWFHDSLNGIRRFFDQVVETAGYWNLVGFNDDTRAFLSIPARHDLWRRGVSLHLADQIDAGIIGRDDAAFLARSLSYDFALDSYKLRSG